MSCEVLEIVLVSKTGVTSPKDETGDGHTAIGPPCHGAVLYVNVGTFPVWCLLYPAITCWDGDVHLAKENSRMKVSQNHTWKAMKTVLARMAQLVEN